MKLIELLNRVDVVKCACSQSMEISDICYNSKEARHGSLFVAIRGLKTDGHKYIEAAVANGASAVVCETAPAQNVPYILVNNSRKVLAQISNNFFGNPAQSLKLIGVTGTNGKTTTAFLIHHILEQATHKNVGLIGTNVNIIGGVQTAAERTTPESYDCYKMLAQMRDAGSEHVVMEVSSHALALDRVYELEFETAVFTNLTQDHLDFHETLENYLAAKTKLFSMCRFGVLNLDDAACDKIIAQSVCQIQTYSAKRDDADLVAKNINLKADRVEFEAVVRGSINRIALGIPGMFSVYNALAATGCALTLGVALADISMAMKTAKGVPGRAEVVPTPTDFTVLIDYAHSPDGMENILSAARGFTKNNIIAVFGCGGDRDKLKRPIMGQVAEKMADIVIVTSDNPRSEEPMAIIEDILKGIKPSKNIVVEPDRRLAIVMALEMATAGDTVLLLGKGHETYQEVNGVKNHLDEREEVAKFFKGN